MNKLKIEDYEDHTTISREDNHFYPACYLNGGPPVEHSGQIITSIFYEVRSGAVSLAVAIMEVSRSISYIVVRKIDGTWKLTLYEYPIDSIVRTMGKSIKGPYYDENGMTDEWIIKQQKMKNEINS